MSTTVSINEFLSMSAKDILRVTMNDAEFIDLCVDVSKNQQINHPLNVNCLALKYFLEKIKCSTERAELFNILFPKIKENFNKACDLYFKSTNNDEMASEMASLIRTAIVTVCNAVDKTFSESIFMDTLRSMALGVLELLKQIYTFLYKRDTMHQDHEISSGHHTSIMQSNANFHVLRCKIIGILTSRDVNYFPNQLTVIDVKFFNQLVVVLCELADSASIRSNAKVLVEVWKCVAFLCNEKVINSIDRLAIDNFGLDNLEYLSVAVRTVCSCINGFIKDYFEPKIQQNEKIITLHNKAIKFLISLLQRFASSYPPEIFRGHEHILQILLTMMRAANQKVEPYDKTFYQNFISGLQDVLFLICKSNTFVQCFYNVQSGDQCSTEMIFLGLEMLKKTLKNIDREKLKFFVHGNVNIVAKMLQCMSMAIVFRENALYNDLVLNLVNALVMTSNSNMDGDIAVRFLAKCFLENNNILVGYLLIDVWCLRATFLSDFQCYNLVIFWSNINDKFSIVQPIQLQSIRVKVLLQNLYDLLSDANKRLLFVDKPVKENIKLWTTLGLESFPVNTKDQIINMETDIETLYNTFSKERTESALYTLVGYLQLSSNKSQFKENHLPDYLMKLWKLNFNHQTNNYSSLIVALLKYSISFKRNLNNHQHYQILQVLTTITDAPKLNESVKIEILNYLQIISRENFTVEYRNEILRIISQLFTKALTDSDPIIRQLAFRAFSDVTNLEHENNEVIIHDCLNDNESLKIEFRNFVLNDEFFTTFSDEDMTFLLQLESYSYQHKCAETSIVTKLCTDNARLDINDEIKGRIREIIKRMLNDANDLIELSKIHSFPRECRQHIAKLTEDLTHLK